MIKKAENRVKNQNLYSIYFLNEKSRILEYDWNLNGGLEENRTPVLTTIHTDFYMFILFSLVHTLIGNKQAIND